MSLCLCRCRSEGHWPKRSRRLVEQAVNRRRRIRWSRSAADLGRGAKDFTFELFSRGGAEESSPAHSELAPMPGHRMPLAAMLSAGLAVNEAFLHVSGECGAAGHRAMGLSLWQPSPACDWLASSDDEPALRFLPSQLWLIGLGHLGQAYLWGLGLLPYPDPSGLSLVLQDVDCVTPASKSTSILSDNSNLGQKKTRAMAAWAERRGFATSIHERLFDSCFRRQESEPAVALCGADNALARRALDQVGFDVVVEAGLGRGYRDFRSMRLHTLPGSRSASDLWKRRMLAKILGGVPRTRRCSGMAILISAVSRSWPGRRLGLRSLAVWRHVLPCRRCCVCSTGGPCIKSLSLICKASNIDRRFQTAACSAMQIRGLYWPGVEG